MSRGDQRRPARPRSARRGSGAAPGWASFLLVAALVGGGLAGYHYGWISFGTTPPDAAPAPSGRLPGAPGLRLPPLPAAARVVAQPARSTGLDAAAVRRALGAAVTDPHLGRLRAVVAPLTGAPVYVRGRGLSMPASTTKLLTTTAALEVLGPDHTFATRVVSTGRGRITLVGGGDPFLTSRTAGADVFPRRASLQDLAARTAKALHRRHVEMVRLAYDTSLFSGPRSSPHWPGTYLSEGVVAPITALWADEGAPADGTGRVADPSATAAAYFATFLARDGVAVLGTPRDRPASPRAPELARVTSAPLADIVERVLDVSDNEGAEVIGHQLGLAVTKRASFDGGVAAVRQTLPGLGIALRGARLYDGSGLSRDDRLDAETLVQVLQVASSPDHPELRSVVTGLPVAGFEGSLEERFDATTAPAGSGWVRAKTGTLTGTSALAGLATDARGRLLVFAFVSNRLRLEDTLDARAALDDLTARLAACRC